MVVGGGAMAALRVGQLVEAGAQVAVVAPQVRPDLARLAAEVHRRPFAPEDLDGAWSTVAAATSEVNREVARAAQERRVFLNAVDDPAQASACTAGVVRRGAVTVAVSTGGAAPALAGLLRQALDALLPRELEAWAEVARAERPGWKRDGLPLGERRPLLLRKLVELHGAQGREPWPERATAGLVSLVGAGPGEAAYLTLRGRSASGPRTWPSMMRSSIPSAPPWRTRPATASSGSGPGSPASPSGPSSGCSSGLPGVGSGSCG